MNIDLYRQLKKITPEEQLALNGQGNVQWSIYTDRVEEYVVEHEKLLEENRRIALRKHTRFVDFPLHTHNYVEFFYVLSGSITHRIGGEELTIGSGELLFMNQHVSHGIRRCGENDLAINLIIMPEFFAIFREMVGGDNLLAEFMVNVLQQEKSVAQYLYFPVSDDLCIQNLAENLIYSILHPQNNGEKIVESTMGLLFLYLMEKVEEIQVSSEEKSENVLTLTIRQYINDEYCSGTLEELGRRTGYSTSRLSRLIRRYTGMTFKELQLKQRMKKAMQLLKESSMPIQEIALDVGYKNQSYFYKQFRQEFSKMPGEVRQRTPENMNIR